MVKLCHGITLAILCSISLADSSLSQFNYGQDYFEGSLISDYHVYAETKIKTKSIPVYLWDWLEQNEPIKQELFVAMYPDFNSEVIEYLSCLYDKFEKHVEQYPHLAIAFSVVYGNADANKQDFRPDLLQWWVKKNREVPSCQDSFQYYINNYDRMLYPLDKFQWPLLLFIADNDIPLQERHWVQNQYKNKSIGDLGNLYGEIKHNGGAGAYTRTKSQAPGKPMALNQVLLDGGVCSQQAYYSSRVLKSLGVPSVRLMQPGHSFLAWVEGQTRLKTKFGGDHSSRKYEYFFNPNRRINQDGYELQMLISAINLSYETYLKSKVASFVFENLSDNSKKQAQELLDTAITNNRYVIDTWLIYAKACKNDVFSQEVALALYDKAEKLLPEFPQLLCIILNDITSAKMTEEAQRQIPIKFRNTIRLISADRPDLAFNVFTTHFNFLVQSKGIDSAVKQSSKWFKLKNLDVSFQEKLFNHIYKTSSKAKPKIQEKWLSQEYLRIRKILQENAKNERNYNYFSKVAATCISHYNSTGDKGKIAMINKDISIFRGDVIKDIDIDLLANNNNFILGITKQEVSQISPSNEACYVWGILYKVPKEYTVSLEAKHSNTGKEGAFHFTAWSDSDNDGLPDSPIACSELKETG